MWACGLGDKGPMLQVNVTSAILIYVPMYAVTHTAAGMHKVTIVEHRNVRQTLFVRCQGMSW